MKPNRSVSEFDDEGEITEIELPVCHNPGSLPMTEVIEAVRLGPSRFRLLHSPGVVDGLARYDVIELTDSHSRGFDVISRAGFLCVWFYFEELGRNRGPDGDAVREVVERFGGICEGGGNTNLIFSIPVSFGFQAVESLMDDLVSRYPGASWLFGNVYDPWNEFAPIGWWESMPPLSENS